MRNTFDLINRLLDLSFHYYLVCIVSSKYEKKTLISYIHFFIGVFNILPMLHKNVHWDNTAAIELLAAFLLTEEHVVNGSFILFCSLRNFILCIHYYVLYSTEFHLLHVTLEKTTQCIQYARNYLIISSSNNMGK